MFNRIFLLICILILPIYSHTQVPQIAKDYHKAMKDKTLKPIVQYFPTRSEMIKMLSWPQTPLMMSYVDSMNQSYQDSLLRCLKEFNIDLKKNGFNLKRSKLIKTERSLGVFGQLVLHLSYKKQTMNIYVPVMDIDGKDCLLDSYPSRVSEEKPPSTSLVILNNKHYPIWHLRRSEIEKVREIIRSEEPIKMDGEIYSNYGWMGLTHGIITEEGRRYAYTKAFREGNHIIIVVDFKEEKVVKIEKEVPFQEERTSSIDRLSGEELLKQLRTKHGEALVNDFLLVREKKAALNLFLDSLRKELIQQSGGYLEKNGQSIINGRKDKETPHKIFITEGNGQALKQKILELVNEWLTLLDDPEKRRFLREELSLEIEENRWKEMDKTWEEYVFGNMPVAAILPMLRKFENDAQTSEAMVIRYLLDNE